MEMVFILLAIFIILMLLRVPIAVSMGLSSLVGFMLIGYNLTTVGSTLYTAVASTAMITIPGYIFAGSIMANGGISKNLLEALKGWDWSCSRRHRDRYRSGVRAVRGDYRLGLRYHRGRGWSDDPGHERIEL